MFRWEGKLSKKSINVFLVLYIGFGFLLISLLHVWYASKIYGSVQVGLPFLRFFRIVIEPIAAGGLSIVDGLIAGMSYYFLLRWFPRLWNLSGRSLKHILIFIGLLGFLISLISQLISGTSWSKFVLDILLILNVSLIILSFVVQPSIWEIMGVYLAIVFGTVTLASSWLGFVQEYNFPNFPATTYFLSSSVYIIFFSLVFVLKNVSFRENR